MNAEYHARLKRGNLVRHKHSGSAMVVVEIVEGVPVLARYTAMSNPREWDVVNGNGEVVSED